MVIEVDIKKLIENLKKEKEAKPADLSDGIWYLMEQVYATLNANRPLTVGDIDFERFEHEEAWDFANHINGTLHDKECKVEAVYGLFSKYRPKINAQRAFF